MEKDKAYSSLGILVSWFHDEHITYFLEGILESLAGEVQFFFVMLDVILEFLDFFFENNVIDRVNHLGRLADTELFVELLGGLWVWLMVRDDDDRLRWF